MKKKNKDSNPIFYKDVKDLEKPVNELIEELRSDLSRIRGKLFDIRHMYGWDDRIEHLEGGFTCLLVAMHSTKEEIKLFELKNNV